MSPPHCSQANDEADVNASVLHLVAAVNARDINGIMAYYTPDENLFVFDALRRRQYVGGAPFRKDWEGFLAAYPGAVHAEVSDWKTETRGTSHMGTASSEPTGQTVIERRAVSSIEERAANGFSAPLHMRRNDRV